jgi:2',3'-cyclic-nucleotide 2'-phosphodiesterase (5'-nucleotidase family)
MYLQIFFSNDLHSRYEQLGKMYTILKKNRTNHSLLFDTGDQADFMRVESEGTHGIISARVMNALEYDGFCYGNNEGFFTLEHGHHFVPKCNFPTVTSNLYTLDRKKLPYLKDYAVIQRFGLKILILGVTAAYNRFYNLFGLYTSDPKEELQKTLTQLNLEEYDLIILLSHLGIDDDKQLAQEFPQLNLIIGGHSHTVLEQPLIINKIPIIQAGDYGNYLGLLNVEVNSRFKNMTILDHKLFDVNKYPSDPMIDQIISECKKTAIKNMAIPLYSLSIPLELAIDQESMLGNALADGLCQEFEADLGLINSGVLNHTIPKGPISKLLLHEVCPSPLNPALLKIKGKDIADSIQLSLDPNHCMQDGSGAGFRSTYIGFLCVSHNVKIEYSNSPLIQKIRINGREIDLEREYLVATSDYLERGSGYPNLAHNSLIKYSPDFLRNTLEKNLNNRQILENASKKRFHLILK